MKATEQFCDHHPYRSQRIIEELKKYIKGLKSIDSFGCSLKRDRVWASKSELMYFIEQLNNHYSWNESQ